MSKFKKSYIPKECPICQAEIKSRHRNVGGAIAGINWTEYCCAQCLNNPNDSHFYCWIDDDDDHSSKMTIKIESLGFCFFFESEHFNVISDEKFIYTEDYQFTDATNFYELCKKKSESGMFV